MSEHKNAETTHVKNGNGKEKEIRLRIASNMPWEAAAGYSRAVRCGNMIFIAGTTASNEKGEVADPNDPKEQTLHALRNIEKALKAAGASLKDVVQTRIYVVDIDHCEEIGKVHADFFKDIRPAASMVEVSSLIHPDMLVEIEAIAVIAENGNGHNGNGHFS